MKKNEKTTKPATSAKKTTAAKKTVKKTAKPAAPERKVTPRSNVDINPEYTDAFIQEVSEEVKNDNFKELWKRYGVFVVAIVVIAVSAAVSFEKIRSWKIEQNQRRTETYMAAAQGQEDPESTIASLQKINQTDHGIYGDFAKLQIANVLLQQNKNDEAFAELEAIIADKNANEEVKNIALVKLATYKVDTMSRQDMEEFLKPILSADNSWNFIANDLLAMTAIREGDIETAKEIYQSLLKVKDLPDSLRTKIQDIMSSMVDM